jgi:hypothetical protein
MPRPRLLKCTKHSNKCNGNKKNRTVRNHLKLHLEGQSFSNNPSHSNNRTWEEHTLPNRHRSHPIRRLAIIPIQLCQGSIFLLCNPSVLKSLSMNRPTHHPTTSDRAITHITFKLQQHPLNQTSTSHHQLNSSLIRPLSTRCSNPQQLAHLCLKTANKRQLKSASIQNESQLRTNR